MKTVLKSPFVIKQMRTVNCESIHDYEFDAPKNILTCKKEIVLNTDRFITLTVL